MDPKHVGLSPVQRPVAGPKSAQSHCAPTREHRTACALSLPTASAQPLRLDSILDKTNEAFPIQQRQDSQTANLAKAKFKAARIRRRLTQTGISLPQLLGKTK